MSAYNFIASNRELNEYSYGIKSVGNTIYIDDELGTIDIFKEDDYYYVKPYTELPYIVCVNLNSYGFDKYSDKLLDYVKKEMENHKQIEIWSTWKDYIKKSEIKSVHINDLNIENLRWVLGNEFFDHPKCLKVYK